MLRHLRRLRLLLRLLVVRLLLLLLLVRVLLVLEVDPLLVRVLLSLQLLEQRDGYSRVVKRGAHREGGTLIGPLTYDSLLRMK